MLFMAAGCGGFLFGLHYIVSALGPIVVLCLLAVFVPAVMWAGYRLDQAKAKTDRNAIEDRANPYEEANKEIATALRAGEPPVTRFAPFLSYKSMDAQTARFVAEQLIGAGHLPWFNEYVIMLEDRSQFLNAIDRGIEQADSAVIVSNTDYRSSDHCIHELRRLLGPTGCGANRLLEVHKPHDPELRAPMKQWEDYVASLPVYHVPKSKVAALESRLQNGDVLGIATRAHGGFCSHVGLAIRTDDGVMRIMHASSNYKKVVYDKSVSGYLNQFKYHGGIIVGRPLEVSETVTDPAVYRKNLKALTGRDIPVVRKP